LITNRTDLDPAPTRHEWAGTFFCIGARLGNDVRRNTDLYCWDIEEFYACLIRPEDGPTWGKVPWMDDAFIAENSVEMGAPC
jgi:hypothetical protein